MWWWLVYRSSPKCWTLRVQPDLRALQVLSKGLPAPGVSQNYAYSTASLEGTYTLSMAAGDARGSIVSPISFLGVLVLDGNGNITGTLTQARHPLPSRVNSQLPCFGDWQLFLEFLGNGECQHFIDGGDCLLLAQVLLADQSEVGITAGQCRQCFSGPSWQASRARS